MIDYKYGKPKVDNLVWFIKMPHEEWGGCGRIISVEPEKNEVRIISVEPEKNEVKILVHRFDQPGFTEVYFTADDNRKSINPTGFIRDNWKEE